MAEIFRGRAFVGLILGGCQLHRGEWRLAAARQVGVVWPLGRYFQREEKKAGFG